MSAADINQRIAVCSWSLQPTDLEDLLTKLQDTGLTRVQLALDPLRDAPEKWRRLPERFAELGVSIVSGMFGCLGEDYSTMESIRITGGIAPDATWEQNRKNIESTAAAARALGLKLVTFHAGFLPHDPEDQAFSKMLKRLHEVADIFDRANIKVGLETGQETASALGALLQKLDRQNVVVNFDPANMILYGKGDPVQALEVLGRWIQQVHLKDGVATRVPGTWGEEVPAGTGEVDWAKFFATLIALKFNGPVVIEREAGKQRVADIRRARQLAERFLQ
jgi:L-ribulose-5-phosphate 3-epimerase